jgi:hypothetical protein
MSGSWRGWAGDLRSARRASALRRGILAVLIGLLLLLAAAVVWMVQPFLSIRRRASVPARADPARLAQDVETLVRSHSPRDFAHPENLRSASEWLAESLRDCGAKVRFQEFVAGGMAYRNVIGELGPSSEDRIIVGAHYDTDGPFPGADDNASGVAGLLELGRLLSDEPLETRVELVAYALEEIPFFATEEMGSFVHARSLRAAGARVRAMLCLEMIGFYSDRPGSQGFPFALLRLFYPNRGNFIAVVGRPRDGLLVRRVKAAMRSSGALPVHSINAPRLVPGVDLSDHASYWNNGYPAVMITDTAFYRNPAYHTERDTPDTLDYVRMAAVVDAIRSAVRSLSVSAARPGH